MTSREMPDNLDSIVVNVLKVFVFLWGVMFNALKEMIFS